MSCVCCRPVVAVVKPAGLPVMPSELYYEHTVMAVLQRLYGSGETFGSSSHTGQNPTPSPAHRLGAWTTGILLCGRSAAARKSLPGQFQARTVVKEYRALVVGIDMPDSFSVHEPIGQVTYPGLHGGLWAVCATELGGKHAVSHCRVLERRPAPSPPSSPAAAMESNHGIIL